MAFYDLSPAQRAEQVKQIRAHTLRCLQAGNYQAAVLYFGDDDTYIRKSAYLCTGRIYLGEPPLRGAVMDMLEALYHSPDDKVRQTVINSAGEIGMHDFETVRHFFDRGLHDAHHRVRNAVIGSMKKMGEKNPVPLLAWAQIYLHDPNPEIRREICHGIELRGRKYPQDILPLLQQLQFDEKARVKNTLVHVLGQIAYKKGCLKTVIAHLKTWDNHALVLKACEEIVDVHRRYPFALQTADEALAYIRQQGFPI